MKDRGEVWLDCDPGHDDAIALLVALFASQKDGSPSLKLLGVSTVHGNASGSATFYNAVRLLSAYKIPPSQCKVWRGADVPLTRMPRQGDVGIHGEDGLGGVEGLPDLEDDYVQKHLLSSNDDQARIPPASPLALVSHLIDMLQTRLESKSPRITLIATGPLTNLALLIKMCPGDSLQLLKMTVESIVIMGGAAGVIGNRTPLAEWNILVDPEAASIVFDSPLPVVMAGLNVTHQAIFTPHLHRQLLLSKEAETGQSIEELHQMASPLRRLVSSAMTFFASTYASEFGFDQGPPIHDMLAVAYVLDPTLFYSKIVDGIQQKSKRYAVKIDTSDGLSAGTTIVDFHNQWNLPKEDTSNWQIGGRNVIVLENVDVHRLWQVFFNAVDCAEAHSLQDQG